ncbi:aldose epimerase family protein [Pontibacter sp. G13]|uniref:aldose epimerase family protein n=1 Tax=Pontibacter sp. G13 TaxID=3074898 RepID=UPI00288904A5|nr:aldose epimerase family protein [Pontibacter sp. G13]WNJ19113.1 aldose epimerase family protein [Pontibacter sp. G13]
MFRPSILGIALAGMLAWGCQTTPTTSTDTTTTADISGGVMMPNQTHFQQEIDGKSTDLYHLEGEGIKVAISNHGGRIVSLWVKDKAGEWTDIVLGFNELEPFRASYYGATIGRYGNRIAKGAFIVDGVEYQVPVNNGVNSLHGGPKGFHDVVWEVEESDSKHISMRYVSPDGDMGYPGELNALVTFTVTEGPGLQIDYEATTDAPTVVNLTNHAFYNLNGEGEGSINDHQLKINAAHFTPVDEGLIPTGELRPVKGTPFDFSELTVIGSRVEVENEQLAFGKGYDHNFALNIGYTDTLHYACTVIGDQSGIQMDIWTQEPGLQFYGGNFMDGSLKGKAGNSYEFRNSFALETQHFPDSPNHPDFPNTELRPGETYQTSTLHTFSVVK